MSAAAFAGNIGGPDSYLEETKTFKEVKHTAFQPGEKLRYRMTYGVFDAGEAVLTVTKSGKQVQGRELWNVKGIGRTISAFEWFYKVYDRYESYIDAKGVFPWVFTRRVDEGGYKIEQDYTFYQHQNKVDNGDGKKFTTPDMVQDMISAFYYARTIDFSNAKIGDRFKITIFMDDELFPTEIEYRGKEIIKTRTGKYRCHKFRPVVQEGRVFNSPDDLEVWITDDGNKIPIMARANIKVGSVKMHLVEWEGLVNPMARVK
jgi:hypothetical protein